MTDVVRVLVLCGGTSQEREVSLRSGKALAAALEQRHRVELLCMEEEALPTGIHALDTIVFPALHGRFGEDGQLQALLESAGIEFCGSGSAASRLCMDKVAAKELAWQHGIPTPRWTTFEAPTVPLADAIIAQMGASLVVKPVDQGSSVGLHFTQNRSSLGGVLSCIHQGRWLIEQQIRGRELTVGLLEGKAMGVVEIVSAGGVYDYAAKYTDGTTKYLFPAELKCEVERQIKEYAEHLFHFAGCRDFARIDFLLEGDCPYFLEINTLPGLTATSLLPKSAACLGYDFENLADALVAPALKRLSSHSLGGLAG